MLRLFLFGSPQIEVDSQAVPLRHTKPLGLLAYLTLTRQPQHRDALLGLLWPEFDESSARNNLRRELSRLKTVLGTEVFVADRSRVHCNPETPVWLDVAAFQEHIDVWNRHGHSNGTACAVCAGALTSAVELYRNDFMAGFSLSDSPAFDEWQFFQREQLRQQLAGALQVLIAATS